MVNGECASSDIISLEYSQILDFFAPVAQWTEQSRPKGKVGGSTPSWGTFSCYHIYIILLLGVLIWINLGTIQTYFLQYFVVNIVFTLRI